MVGAGPTRADALLVAFMFFKRCRRPLLAGMAGRNSSEVSLRGDSVSSAPLLDSSCKLSESRSREGFENLCLGFIEIEGEDREVCSCNGVRGLLPEFPVVDFAANAFRDDNGETNPLERGDIGGLRA